MMSGIAPPTSETTCYLRSMLRFCFLLLLPTWFLVAQETAPHWIPLAETKVEIAGLPWFRENQGEFWRLPTRSKEAFPKAV